MDSYLSPAILHCYSFKMYFLLHNSPPMDAVQRFICSDLRDAHNFSPSPQSPVIITLLMAYIIL